GEALLDEQLMQRFVRGGGMFLGQPRQVLRGEDTFLDQTLSQLHADLVVAASGGESGCSRRPGRGQVRIKPPSPLQGNVICAACLQPPPLSGPEPPTPDRTRGHVAAHCPPLPPAPAARRPGPPRSSPPESGPPRRLPAPARSPSPSVRFSAWACT